MNLLGVHLTLMIGETIPVTASPFLVEALRSVEVTHSDQGPSGFQLTFQVGRIGALDLMDYRVVTNPRLKPFNRVIVIVRYAIAPQVLMDGIITNQQLNPSNEPGASTLTVTGEDVSVMMDLEEREGPRSFPALPDYGIVTQLVGSYTARFGLQPPSPPLNPEALTPRNPMEEITQQPANMTDRAYLQALARQYGFVFYVTPGPAPLISQVHWGPPERLSIPQGALSMNMGPATNIESINFLFDGLKPEQVTAPVNGREQVFSEPSFPRGIIRLAEDRPSARRKTFWVGQDADRAGTYAQGAVDLSFDDVVTANGQLDALRYNGLLQPRGLVGVRGVGKTYDGFYYVKSVTHNISKGRYTQSFSLSREGTGTTTPFVLP
jgi:hypothetical protein